jgi:hypothetical protein
LDHQGAPEAIVLQGLGEHARDEVELGRLLQETESVLTFRRMRRAIKSPG